MRPWGWAIAISGLIYMFIAFNMDVSVSTQSTYIPGYGSFGGGEVANLDLMARRQNHVIVAGIITLIGALMGIFGSSSGTPSQVTENPKATEHRIYDGKRDISEDAYRLWLADEYQIKKNDVFEKFVIGDVVFDTLDAALLHADKIENEKIEKEEAAKIEKERINKELIAESQRELERAAEQWKKDKPKFVVGGIATVIFIAIIILYAMEKNKENAERALVIKISQLKDFEKTYKFSLPAEKVSGIKKSISQSEEFLCADRKEGTLVRFAPKTLASEILPIIDKALGAHKIKYEYEGSGEWFWDKENMRFQVNSISSEVTLCISKIE